MSFMQDGHPWSTGYAIPEYVRAEPPMRGTFTTRWLPRGTIPGLIPDFLAKPASKKLTGRADVHLGLGAQVYELLPTGDAPPAQITPGDPQDPIRVFGESVAVYVMREVRKLPAADRKNALRLLLDGFDQTLYGKVTERAQKFEKEGIPAAGALQKALSIVFSNTLGEEIVQLGKSGKAPSKGILSRRHAKPLGWNWDDVGNFFGKVGDKISSAACSILTNPLAPAAGAGVAAASDVPPQIGAVGVVVGAGMCASDKVPTMPPGALLQTTPSWLLPVAIGGGALLLVMALK